MELCRSVNDWRIVGLIETVFDRVVRNDRYAEDRARHFPHLIVRNQNRVSYFRCHFYPLTFHHHRHR